MKDSSRLVVDAPQRLGGQRPRRLSNRPARAVADRSQDGQGIVEYGFILTLVAVVVMTMLLTTGQMVMNLLSNVTTTMHQAGL